MRAMALYAAAMLVVVPVLGECEVHGSRRVQEKAQEGEQWGMSGRDMSSEAGIGCRDNTRGAVG